VVANLPYNSYVGKYFKHICSRISSGRNMEIYYRRVRRRGICMVA